MRGFHFRDVRHSTGRLLRAHDARPRYLRATEKGDELAPSDLDCHPTPLGIRVRDITTISRLKLGVCDLVHGMSEGRLAIVDEVIK